MSDPHIDRSYRGRRDTYRIVSELAKGGMGHIFRAEDSIGRSVVLKFPTTTNKYDDPYDTENTRLRIGMLRAESDFLKRLAGPPSIVKYIDESQDPDDFFLVIEEIDGENLCQKILSGAISEEEVVSFSLDILEGLGHIHDNDIIYRDMKPENIMVGPDGRCILIDFGGAKQGKNAPDTTNTTRLHTKGWVCPEYDVRVSAECDLYSFGKVMYYMATGKTSWDEDNTNEDSEGQLRSRPSQIKPGMNSELSDLIYDLIDPMHRSYSTAGKVARKLRSIDLARAAVEPPPPPPPGSGVGEKTVGAAPPPPPAGPGLVRKALIAGMSISTVAILVIISLQIQSPFDDPSPADVGTLGGPSMQESMVEDAGPAGAAPGTLPDSGAGPDTGTPAAPPPERPNASGPAASSGMADAPLE